MTQISPPQRIESAERDARPTRGVILLVGYHLSGEPGSYGVAEGLAARLPVSGWRVLTTSDQRTPWGRLADMTRTAWRLRHEYQLAHVDIYSGRAFAWAEVVCQELHLLRKPFILTLRGGNLPEFSRRWPKRVRRLLAEASAVTTPSAYLQDHLRRFRSDLILLPNALDLPSYHFRLRESAAPRLVWVRAFHEIYNPELAVETVAALGDRFPSLRLAMTGRDRDGSRLRVLREVRDRGLDSRIRVLDPVAKVDVPARLQEGDVYLNTARIDNTPVTVMEAMACGLCVVSTKVGGIPYLVDDGQNALLVPPGDPTAMASAVARVLEDPALARRLSGNARSAMERFAWPVVMHQWEELLASVAHG